MCIYVHIYICISKETISGVAEAYKLPDKGTDVDSTSGALPFTWNLKEKECRSLSIKSCVAIKGLVSYHKRDMYQTMGCFYHDTSS